MPIALRTLQVYRVMRIRNVSYAVEVWIHVVRNWHLYRFKNASLCFDNSTTGLPQFTLCQLFALWARNRVLSIFKKQNDSVNAYDGSKGCPARLSLSYCIPILNILFMY